MAVGDGPNGVAYNSGNNQIYVANGHDGTVTVLRASDYGLVKTIAVGAHPGGIAVDAGANRVFVANYTAGTVSVIDGATNSVVRTLSVGSEPSMVATNPATHKAYVTLHGASRVAVINSAYNVTLVDIYSQSPYGITVDGVRNLIYAATIDTNRIAVIDGTADTFVTWVEIKRSDGTPVPLRMIGVNADIGTSGHVFLTTAGEDGGFDKFLMLPKGWPEGFDAPRALDLSEGRDGLAFEPTTDRVFVTSRDDDLVATILDGEELCPQNFSIGEYQVWVCMERMGSTCTEYAVK
jgi:YVTN family beta-propeller protein